MIKRVSVRQHVPPWVRTAARKLRTGRVARVKFRLWGAVNRVRFARRRRSRPLAVEGIQDSAGNPGAVPIARTFNSALEIVEAHRDPYHRSTHLPGYEGFAIDDAVFDPVAEAWERLSFARLAGVVAGVGYSLSPSPSVLDLGSGAGHMLSWFERYGIRGYLGIDGNQYFLEFNPLLSGREQHFRVLDLTHDIRLADNGEPAKFDLVISFEVLEHIPEDKLRVLLDTVRAHMHPRSLLICTASRQPELDVHVLVRERTWWLDQFRAAGLRPPPGIASKLERGLARAHPFNWTRRSSHIFVLQMIGSDSN
jgi:SAM-dependent methyltransferase